MTRYRHFVKEIMKVTFGMAIVLTGLCFIPFYRSYVVISWFSLVFFMFLTLFSGFYNSRSIKKPFFLNIFFVTLAIKSALSIVFIATYFYLFDPTKWVIFPIMFFFGAYKVFETVMLLRFSKDLPDVPYPEKYERS